MKKFSQLDDKKNLFMRVLTGISLRFDQVKEPFFKGISSTSIVSITSLNILILRVTLPPIDFSKGDPTTLKSAPIHSLPSKGQPNQLTLAIDYAEEGPYTPVTQPLKPFKNLIHRVTVRLPKKESSTTITSLFQKDASRGTFGI